MPDNSNTDPKYLLIEILKKRIRELVVLAVLCVSVTCCFTFYALLNMHDINKPLQQYIDKQLKSEFQTLQQQRDAIADSMKYYRLEIKGRELRDQETEKQIEQQQQLLLQIQGKYETIEKLHHYDNYTNDSIKRDFSKEFGNR